jgi:hypothetical protein
MQAVPLGELPGVMHQRTTALVGCGTTNSELGAFQLGLQE